MIEEEIFKKYKVDFNKLITYGFIKKDKLYEYQKTILDNKFRVEITINENNELKGKIIEEKLEEEYTNFRCKDITGEFASLIKEKFIEVLKEIRDYAFLKSSFKYDQSNRITAMIKEKYQTDPEFLWQNDDNTGVFRNNTNHKWYGIVMNINKSKLDEKSNQDVEVINVKINPSDLGELLKKKGFYEAYHMNKKNWVSIVLDETINDETIINLIDISYKFTL